MGKRTYDIPADLVQTHDEAVENIKAYATYAWSDLSKLSDEEYDLFTKTGRMASQWYCVYEDSQWYCAPAKFAGYRYGKKPLTPQKYHQQQRDGYLHGTYAHKALQKVCSFAVPADDQAEDMEAWALEMVRDMGGTALKSTSQFHVVSVEADEDAAVVIDNMMRKFERDKLNTAIKMLKALDLSEASIERLKERI